jgi:hypothetical protein
MSRGGAMSGCVTRFLSPVPLDGEEKWMRGRRLRVVAGVIFAALRGQPDLSKNGALRAVVSLVSVYNFLYIASANGA